MSSRRTGPSGPATFEFWLSPTGAPVSLVMDVVCAATGPANRPAIPKAMIVRIWAPSHYIAADHPMVRSASRSDVATATHMAMRRAWFFARVSEISQLLPIIDRMRAGIGEIGPELDPLPAC